MRINVYAEELTEEVTIVDKVAADGKRFYGIRMYLKSPAALHHSPQDDDRSAITFWIPWTHANGYDFDSLENIFREMSRLTLRTGRAVKGHRDNLVRSTWWQNRRYPRMLVSPSWELFVWQGS